MTIQTVTWIPPGLCNCRFQITGDFADKDVINGVSYKHPKKHTITSLKLLNACNGHASYTKSMIDTSVFFDDVPSSDVATFLAQKYGALAPSQVQNRGYLTYPIANPTPDEILYTFFSQYSGQREKMACGCVRYGFVDDTDYALVKQQGMTSTKRVPTYIHHDVHTVHCQFHLNDTPDCANAMQDHNDYLAQIAAVQPAS